MKYLFSPLQLLHYCTFFIFNSPTVLLKFFVWDIFGVSSINHPNLRRRSTNCWFGGSFIAKRPLL